MIFVAKNLTASRVNLIMNDYAAGLPSPLSFLGLADSIVRDLGLAPWSGRVIPVLHEVTPSLGRTKPEMEKKGAGFGPIEILEDMHGYVRASIIFDLPGCSDETAIARALSGKRIAGGVISPGNIQVEAAGADGTVFTRLRRGYAMVRPEGDARLRTCRGDSEGLSRIARELFPVEKPKGYGWIVPCAAGYRLLETPDSAPERTGTRDRSIPHVFAEPLAGIAELVSVRNARLKNSDEKRLNDLFWKWTVREDLILGHQDYTFN